MRSVRGRLKPRLIGPDHRFAKHDRRVRNTPLVYNWHSADPDRPFSAL